MTNFEPTPHELAALRDGNLSLILRPVVPQPESPGPGAYFDAYDGGPQWDWWAPDNKQYLTQIITCPIGQPGDVLEIAEERAGDCSWVRRLRVVSVRCLRVQGLLCRDVLSAGFETGHDPSFVDVWDKTHANTPLAYDRNPYVWAVSVEP